MSGILRTSQELIIVKFHRLDKIFMCKSKMLNKCIIHTAMFKPKPSFFSQEIISRKYSTKTPQVSGGLGVSLDQEEDKNVIYHSVKHEDQKEEEEIPKSKEMIFNEIADGDAEILKKLKILEFEMEVLREQGVRVVSSPTKSQWEELLKYFDYSPLFKKKMLSFMALNEKLQFNKLKKKDNISKIKLKKKEDSGFHYYGLSGHSIVPALCDDSLNKVYTLRNCMADSKLLIDFSYDEFMNEKCKRNLAKQIQMSLLEVRSHQYPCQLGFCNLEKNSPFGELIEKYVGHVFTESFFCDVSAQSPTDLYPKENLVYLSPHAQNDLIEINKNDIYIIGGFVDKGICVKASLAKGKKENLRMARLPIDLYLFWKQGNKTLPINNVVKIMLDMMFYNDWNRALKTISSRSVNDTFMNRNKLISSKL